MGPKYKTSVRIDGNQLTVYCRPLEIPYRIHLRTLTQNNPHPEASHPILIYQPSSHRRFDSFTISAFEDTLAILFSSVRPSADVKDETGELVIWNWRAGIERAVSSFAVNERLFWV